MGTRRTETSVSGNSAIEWTDATWNPVTGCSKVSPGCDHCYAETLSLRFGWSKLSWTHGNAARNVVLHPERLRMPLSWRKPRMVFVNSMSDMFHENVPLDFLAEVWDVMVRTPQHTYQVLTKRPQRIAEALGPKGIGFYAVEGPVPCPQPNIWLGTSIESWRFNYRADQLRLAPAAVRFISAEPLLDTLYPTGRKERSLNLTGIDWVIVGGESGHGARPMHHDWAREIRDACLCDFCRPIGGRLTDPFGPDTCSVCEDDERPAFFFKQWGGKTPKSGGRLLDGREWNEMPAAVLFPNEERLTSA